MPELPEVEVTRREIAPSLCGRRITRARTTRDSYFFLTPPRVLRRRLSGRTVQRIDRLGEPIRPLMTGFDASYQFLEAIDDTFYFRTDRDAPRGRIIVVDVNDPEPGAWRTVVPESEDVIDFGAIANGRMIVGVLHDEPPTFWKLLAGSNHPFKRWMDDELSDGASTTRSGGVPERAP